MTISIQEEREARRTRALERLKATKARLAKERSGAAFTAPDRDKMPKNNRDATNNEPLPPVAETFKNYIEYDFSKMKDTRGGFIADEQDQASSTKTLDQWRESNRFTQGPFPLDHPDAPKCFECGNTELDFKLFDVFKCRVCRGCREKYPDKYSLLTKTECKEDYLLTDPELRDTELLPHLEKPNPHKSTYNNMMLFLRYQVEEVAFKKWGGPEGLDKEYERRVADKKARKDKKFIQRLRDMRRKTRAANVTKRYNTEHSHDWIVESTEDKIVRRKCTLCGMMKEEMVF